MSAQPSIALPVKAMPALKPEQASAAAPDVHAWVAASAGTGKTQVLSARVLRLLLQGTPPQAILCLTFTKLAAAEMKTRIFDRLAHWARCDAAALAHDLAALRAGDHAEMMGRARRLFATVLDAPQGLAIETIHAFAQGLIASFPVEAGVAPGFQTLADRDGTALRRRLLGEAIDRADSNGDGDFLADLAAISIAGGEARLATMVAKLSRYDVALATLRREAATPMLRRGFGLAPGGDADTALAASMAKIDRASVRRIADALAAAGNVNAVRDAGRIRTGLLATTPEAMFAALVSAFLTATDKIPRKQLIPKAADSADPELKPLCDMLSAVLVAALAEQRLEQAVALAACHLRVGIVLAADWRAAKTRLGVIDYDDMIAAAVRLLDGPTAAEWVRYKLDQRIDHVLVDEAQDTNEAQWDIIESLVAEFFAGDGARDVQRTLFVVGDYKQAIFGFQGSDPKVYADKKEHFAGLAKDARELWRDIPLAINFRSVPAVLRVVDAVAEELGHAALDRSGVVPPHVANREGLAGAVTLWPPVRIPADDNADPDDAGEEGQAADDTDSAEAPGRVTRADVLLAHKVAAQIAQWLDPAHPLRLPSNGKRVEAQDILVLVRSRSAFSGALVAALHQAGVPVAGVDRLKLVEPLAVADLLALVRFALQPGDDLTLASLLVSPFLDLDHDQLFDLADRRRGSLWDAVRDSADPRVALARDWLMQLLGFADFTAPYAFFEQALSGPLQARKKLLDRLGEEARDAIDAVLDQALAFEALQAPSLQGFLAFVDDDSIEIKRDPDAPLAAVRLMTVHGAKGLQAPVVIMADATKKRHTGSDAPLPVRFDNGPALPVFLSGRSGFAGRLGEEIDAAEQDDEREHCRLLYVALTRAEDLLFIGGALGPTGDAPEDSWYATVERAMTTLGAEVIDAPGWDEPLLRYRSGVPAAPADDPVLKPDDALSPPAWLHAPAPRESRPPRPLSPSAIAADGVSAPPASPEMRAAARRGSALHALFERLPEIAPDRRRSLGEAFVGAGFPDLDASALLTTALAVLDDTRFAAVFAAGALTEAPIAAVVNDIVIAGSVDRLLVSDTEVLVVDFKTGRRVPADAAAVDVYHLKQMAAYVAALGKVFPDRPVRAALLYTEGPALIAIPDAMLALHAPQADLSLSAPGDALIYPA